MRVLLFLLFLLLLPSALATVDIVSPAAGALTNAVNLSFEYYPALSNISSCTLTIDSSTFPDATIQPNAFNSFTVVNIDPGSHSWRISCEHAGGTAFSEVRNFTIDRTRPTLQILSPADGATTSNASVRIRTTDDRSKILQCAVNANATFVTSKQVLNGTPTTIPLDLADGTYITMVTCVDGASNERSVTVNMTILAPPPVLFVEIETNKQAYDLGETVGLTLNSIDGANVTLEVCPDEQGFVQCFSPLIGSDFPQGLVLPYANKSGNYIAEAFARLGNQTASASASFTVLNTLSVSIGAVDEPELDKDFTLTATVVGGIGQSSLLWELSNGSTSQGSSITRRYSTIGSFTERVTATDSEGNTATASYTSNLEPAFDVLVVVREAGTGTLLNNATVQFKLDQNAGQVLRTTSSGEARFTLSPDVYKLFVSRTGYEYFLQEINVNQSGTVFADLKREENGRPIVAILSPEEGAQIPLSGEVRFTVDDGGITSCTLSIARDAEEWFQEVGATSVEPGGEGLIAMQLPEGLHRIVVECTDEARNVGKSPVRVVEVSQAGPVTTLSQTASSELDVLDVIDRAYGAYDSFNAEQRRLADLLGWEDIIRERKRIIERSDRDLDAVRYRRDLSEQERETEQERLRSAAAEAGRTTPIDLVILEERTSVTYLREDELSGFVPQIIAQKGLAFDEEGALGFIAGVQQLFAPEQKVIRAEKVLADGTKVPLGVFVSTVKYKAGIELEGLSLYVAVPADVAPVAKEIVTAERVEVLSSTPPALEFPATESLVLYVERDVPLSGLEGIRTILLKQPSSEDLASFTGNATLIGSIDWKASIVLSLGLLLLVLLFHRFNVIRHLKYLLYAESRKKPLHALRTIINDGMAQLEAGSIDAATMRYKEAKLAYERLNEYAQNEVIEDVTQLRRALDSSYFLTLTERIGQAIERKELAMAIDDFERLEGTFSRLLPEEQERLVTIIETLGKKLGLGGGAP